MIAKLSIKHVNLALNLVLVSLLVIGFTLAGHSSATVPKVNELISVDSSGTKATASNNFTYTSADGRYITFSSGSALASNDTRSGSDTYVRDTINDTTTLVSIDTGGTQANAGSSPSHISYDGRYILFTTTATNLDTSDTWPGSDVYLRDTVAGTTELVTKISGYGSNNSSAGQVSADGRFVAYKSANDIYVKDRLNNTTELISKDYSTGNPTTNSDGPTMSCDGAVVMFTSGASTIVSGDTNNKHDVFVATRIGGSTKVTNITIAGNDASGNGDNNTISGASCDGNYLAFYSDASNLVSGDTNSKKDIFRYSRITGQIELVSRDSSGSLANNNSYGASLSGDGRYITFTSSASNLVSSDTNATEDVFIRDLKSGQTELVSQNSSGVFGNYGSYAAFISSDGKYVTYQTTATNLVSGDTDTTQDIIISQTGY